MAGFDVVVQAGDRLQITVESTAFDPVLIVTPPGRQAIQNDDWQGSRNLSRLDLTIEEAGVMKVGVSSFAPGARGAYHLVAQPAPTGDDLANITQIESAQIQGELAAPDSQLSDGRFIEHYQVPASPNQLQEASITSTEGAVPALTVTAADGPSSQGRRPHAFCSQAPVRTTYKLWPPSPTRRCGSSSLFGMLRARALSIRGGPTTRHP